MLGSSEHIEIAAQVRDFYQRHPYPPPVDDLEAYRRSWDDKRRRAESHVVWPSQPYRDDRSILVAGCGTTQAAHYALRWPRAQIVGIDVSAHSIAFTQELKRKHGLDNLDVRLLPVERAAELGRTFEYVVCTGVLHHLADPDAGLRALAAVAEPRAALHLMLYAPYGRAGVYMLAEYCRRLGIRPNDDEIRQLAAALKALPPEHPIVPLLRSSPDFANTAGLADALLHPCDRAYAVPQIMELLDRAALSFGRWMRQAPYLADCGALASSPHRSRLAALTPGAQFAALELFRGTMVRHSFVAYRDSRDAQASSVSFDEDRWLEFVPIRLPDTLVVRERLPNGAAAVLINRNHTYGDLYLPIDAAQERTYNAIDGERTVIAICNEPKNRTSARDFFKQLWQWDQIALDTSAADNGRG